MTKLLFLSLVLMAACTKKPKVTAEGKISAPEKISTWSKVDTPRTELVYHKEFGYTMRKIEYGDTSFLSAYHVDIYAPFQSLLDRTRWDTVRNDILFSDSSFILSHYNSFVAKWKQDIEDRKAIAAASRRHDSIKRIQDAVQMSDFKPVK